MRNTICKRLAPLASLDAQRRYIVHGSRDEYLVPSELLSDASDVVRQVRNMSVVQDSLSAEARKEFLQLDSLMEEAVRSVEAVHSNEELVEYDAAWKAIREQATRCLEIVGFDLREWEKAERIK